MNWKFPWIKNVEVQEWQEERIGVFTAPQTLTDQNAFALANTVPEIYFPIDFIADRVSKLRFFISKNGKEVVNTELNRFVSDINPLWAFSDLVYQAIFSYMADGNTIALRSIPSIYPSQDSSNISRIDILQPDRLSTTEFTNISELNIKDWNDIIRTSRYLYNTSSESIIDPSRLAITRIDATMKPYSMVFSRSPLFKAKDPIKNLLATYSARYNVYVNNGMAGILSRKMGGGGSSLAEVVSPKDKKRILDDINSTYGLTGNKALWGISGVPVEFVKTISSIAELLPFEETLEDSIKIAGVFQIKAGLIPRKDQSTYDNQAGDERSVWENAIMSVAESFCRYWKSACLIQGYDVSVDYSSVSCLKTNEGNRQKVIQQKIINLTALKTMNPEMDITNELSQILTEYGQG